MKKLLAGAAAAALLGSPLVAISAAAPAGAIPPECQKPRSKVVTVKGQTVWVPTSKSAGPFQFGGTQSRTQSDGKMTAKTTGSSDTIGGSGGVNLGVWQASAKYDRQWNRSTTGTTSYSSAFTTTSPTMPNKVHWRWKLYKKGYLFTATKRQWIPDVCPNAYDRKAKFRVSVPIVSNVYSYDVETYKTRGQLHNAKGNPMGF
ncbi:MAG: hypothetical protein CMH83_10325 [Nocardioides sp.]|nr:hypothetical protein [Nocardioides sp.]